MLLAFVVYTLVIVALVSIALHFERQVRERCAGVKVGDIWEWRGKVWSREHLRVIDVVECATVVEKNNSTEAGPNSWRVETLEGRVFYMHLDNASSQWTLLMRDGVPTPLWYRRESTAGQLAR